jgi:hypothetical protein
MSNFETPNNISYINQSAEAYYSELNNFPFIIVEPTISDVPPQPVPELNIVQDPLVIGYKGLLALNNTITDSINQRKELAPINRMDKKTLRILKKEKVSLSNSLIREFIRANSQD